eukprot:15476719-Alexandrium_andersonii.AAC.1
MPSEPASNLALQSFASPCRSATMPMTAQPHASCPKSGQSGKTAKCPVKATTLRQWSPVGTIRKRA